MKKYLPILFLAVVTLKTSGQVITGQRTQTACNGTSFQFATTSYYSVNCVWQVSTDMGVTWTNITDNATYSSGGSSILTIQPNFSLSGNVYRMYIVSDPPTAGDTLVVVNPPANPVFVNPVTSICQGSTIPFTVTGTSFPLINDSIGWAYTGDSYFAYSPDNVYVNDTVILAHFSTSAGSGNLEVSSYIACASIGYTTLPITINTLQSTLAGTAGGGADCASFSVFPGVATTYSDGTCSPIAAVTPSGASPVSGTVQSCVTVEASLPTYNGVPYVGRYYSIEPTTNASTSTATITLYFTQADFNAYNTGRGSYPALPTGPSDATGISNLTISQFHGTGTTPDTYAGTSGTIVPTSVTWNSTASRWEVTFSVTGFSGFFASGSSIIPLPLTLTSFTGLTTASGNELKWVTAMEENTAYFDVERAIAGSGSFLSLDTVPAAGNSEQPLTYTYTDAQAGSTSYSYQLKMVDLDGSFTYSKIITLQSPGGSFAISVSPNPYHQSLSVIVTMPAAAAGNLVVTDAAGHRILQQALSLQKGTNTLDPTALAALAPGMYFLSITTGQEKQTVKLIRE